MIRMLDLAHLGDQIGAFDNRGMSAPAGENHVHHFRLPFQHPHHRIRVQHPVMHSVIDFVQDDEVVLATGNLLARKPPGFLNQADVFRVRFLRADFHEPAAHGQNLEALNAQHPRRVQFSIVPGALDELHHQNLEPLPDGPQGRAQRCRRLAFSRPGMNNNQAFLGFRQTHLAALRPLTRVGIPAQDCKPAVDLFQQQRPSPIARERHA